jgi:hypothetical protein
LRVLAAAVVLAALSSAAGRAAPECVVYQRTPTEVMVWDPRPELGMGMHQVERGQLDMVRRLGVRIVRHTLYWGQMERTRQWGYHDPAYLAEWDQKVERAARMGMTLLVVVHGNPPGTGFASRHEAYRRFAQFMAFAARRWPQVMFWELWNEMDSGFTDLFGAHDKSIPMLDRGKMYAEMLQETYPAIKAANPNAWVLTGGMSDTGDFPRGIYQAGGREYFDIMNIHTYGVPIDWAFVPRGQGIKKIMAANGDANKPLWNTEWGIDAGNLVQAWGVPHTWEKPRDDAEYFDEAMIDQWKQVIWSARHLGIYQKYFPYQFAAGNECTAGGKVDEVRLPEGMTLDDFGFGIVRSDGKTPRPIYNWLLEQQFNADIAAKPSLVTDVRFRPVRPAVPIGHEYERDGEFLVIKNVVVDSLVPTKVLLRLVAE